MIDCGRFQQWMVRALTIDTSEVTYLFIPHLHFFSRIKLRGICSLVTTVHHSCNLVWTFYRW